MEKHTIYKYTDTTLDPKLYVCNTHLENENTNYNHTLSVSKSSHKNMNEKADSSNGEQMHEQLPMPAQNRTSRRVHLRMGLPPLTPEDGTIISSQN